MAQPALSSSRDVALLSTTDTCCCTALHAHFPSPSYPHGHQKGPQKGSKAEEKRHSRFQGGGRRPELQGGPAAAAAATLGHRRPAKNCTAPQPRRPGLSCAPQPLQRRGSLLLRRSEQIPIGFQSMFQPKATVEMPLVCAASLLHPPLSPRVPCIRLVRLAAVPAGSAMEKKSRGEETEESTHLTREPWPILHLFARRSHMPSAAGASPQPARPALPLLSPPPPPLHFAH